MPSPPEYLTTKELAALLKTTPAAVQKMRERRTGPPGFRVGRQVIYKRTDVDLWLDTRPHIAQYV